MATHTAHTAAAAATPAAAPQTAPNGAETPQTAPASAAAAPQSAQTVTITIADVKVTLPLKFRTGSILTDAQAKILDAAYQRQFTNNQVANAKARAEKYAAAKTDAERAANAPLSAADLALLYADYEPAVGGGTRGNALETLRHTTAWRYWTGLVQEHNAAVAAGKPPVFAKLGNKPAALPAMPRKAAGQTDAAYAAAKAKFEDERNTFRQALLDHKEHGPKIAALVEAEIAARKAESGKAGDASGEVAVAGADLL